MQKACSGFILAAIHVMVYIFERDEFDEKIKSYLGQFCDIKYNIIVIIS